MASPATIPNGISISANEGRQDSPFANKPDYATITKGIGNGIASSNNEGPHDSPLAKMLDYATVTNGIVSNSITCSNNEGPHDSQLAQKPVYAANLASIQEAQERIRSFVNVTPVLTSSSVNELAGRNFYFKCELFQKGGAFKFRGATNAILSLPRELARDGVLTHSSGNHAAALAFAAKAQNIPAYIVMPKNAPTCKIKNVRRFGGKIIFCEATMESREETARKVQQETGASMIHSCDDGRVISGAGTVALEFLQQWPLLDAIIAPIGGGGLISGVALAAKAIKPNIRIFAAEPKCADDAAQSKELGRRITLSHSNTVADGLRACLGTLTWPIVRDMVDEVITVEEAEIIAAMRMCYERLKVAVEPSGAVALAAGLSQQFQSGRWKCQHVGIVLTGGNVDLCHLCDLLNNF